MLFEGATERSEASLQVPKGGFGEPPAIAGRPIFTAFSALPALPATAPCGTAQAAWPAARQTACVALRTEKFSLRRQARSKQERQTVPGIVQKLQSR